MNGKCSDFSAAKQPQAHGVRFVRYQTSTRTNWHYEAVNAFLDGAFAPI